MDDNLILEHRLAALTGPGEEHLIRLGVECAPPPHSRRRFACGCLDWSERKPHLGGALGAALLSAFVDHGRIIRCLVSRELALTPDGRRALLAKFNLAFTGAS